MDKQDLEDKQKDLKRKILTYEWDLNRKQINQAHIAKLNLLKQELNEIEGELNKNEKII